MRIWTIACMGLLAGLLEPPPIAAQEAEARPSVVSHALQGMTACQTCHTAGVMPAVPDTPESTHVGRGDETCLWCHAPDASVQTATPSAVSHGLEGQGNCLLCHGGTMGGISAVPEDHGPFPNTSCLWCHTPGSGR